jgi:hypothetical protein
VTLAQSEAMRVPVHGSGFHGNGRLQWRSETGADTVTLMPIAYYHQGSYVRHSVLTQSVGTTPVPYDTRRPTASYASSLLRLNGQWNRRISSTGRLEWRAGVGTSRAPSDSFRTEVTNGVESRTLANDFQSHDTSVSSSIKWVESFFEGHSLVSGAEVESNRRNEKSTVAAERRADPHRRVRRQPLRLGAPLRRVRAGRMGPDAELVGACRPALGVDHHPRRRSPRTRPT